MGICCLMLGAQPGALDNLEEWYGVGGGREIQEGRDTCAPVADSC